MKLNAAQFVLDKDLVYRAKFSQLGIQVPWPPLTLTLLGCPPQQGLPIPHGSIESRDFNLTGTIKNDSGVVGWEFAEISSKPVPWPWRYKILVTNE